LIGFEADTARQIIRKDTDEWMDMIINHMRKLSNLMNIPMHPLASINTIYNIWGLKYAKIYFFVLVLSIALIGFLFSVDKPVQ